MAPHRTVSSLRGKRDLLLVVKRSTLLQMATVKGIGRRERASISVLTSDLDYSFHLQNQLAGLQHKYNLHILTQKTFIMSMKERRAFVKEEKADATNINKKSVDRQNSMLQLPHTDIQTGCINPHQHHKRISVNVSLAFREFSKADLTSST